jgi:hypothetical protein
MENQCFEAEGYAALVNPEREEVKQVFELQLALIGGGCVEYCPY